MRKEANVLNELRCWAENHDQIRGMVLTSSRTNPEAIVDLLSDYDVEIYVRDLQPFKEGDDWLEALGAVMTRWPSKPALTDEGVVYRLVIYEDGVRIDWGVDEAASLAKFNDPFEASEPYTVLIDKDHLVKNPIQQANHAFHVKKPTETEYGEVIDEFWWDITYVAKSLWRDELYWAKYMNGLIHFSYLEKVIEWFIGMQQDWTVNTNKHGRWFEPNLDAATWTEIEATFSGADEQENWDALFRTTCLFRRLAVDVADRLGYSYPYEVDKRVTAYLLKIKHLDRDAEDFV